jgi:hypothetical protein
MSAETAVRPRVPPVGIHEVLEDCHIPKRPGQTLWKTLNNRWDDPESEAEADLFDTAAILCSNLTELAGLDPRREADVVRGIFLWDLAAIRAAYLEYYEKKWPEASHRLEARRLIPIANRLEWECLYFATAAARCLGVLGGRAELTDDALRSLVIRVRHAANAPTTPVQPTPTPSKAADPPKGRKGKHIRARVIDLLAKEPESLRWTQRQFAERLDCSASTIADPKVWGEVERIRQRLAVQRIVTGEGS